jgi:uncharacterized protein
MVIGREHPAAGGRPAGRDPSARGESALRMFGVAHVIAACCLVAAFFVGGVQALVVVALLGVLEVAVSFDNAIVNATVLARLSRYWQRMFMTVGVLVAAIGMRLLVPLAVVSIGARLSPWSAVSLAYSDPTRYRGELLRAQPSIAAFGGAFLLMIFLEFVLAPREEVWIPWIERPLRRVGRLPNFGQICVLVFAAVAAGTVAHRAALQVVVGSVCGLACFLLVNGVGELVAQEADADGSSRPRATTTGRAAFFLFCYLELLDATFSFDSVMGAFSVTLDIALITLGLAIGAAYIRCLTVFVVRRGTLEQYRYLEHGAYYAIGMLALLLMIEVWHDVPDVLTAGMGAAMIVAAILSSVWESRRSELRRRRDPGDRPDAEVHAGPGHDQPRAGADTGGPGLVADRDSAA